jgi:DNA-directed RNA polymerase subunit N (RpoN/RPB10)
MPRDLIPVRCHNCGVPGTVTRTLWQRVMKRMACGNCRKTTTWNER